MARRTVGRLAIARAPKNAIVENQTRVIGPNSLPTLPVPRRWMANSPTRMTQVSGTTTGSSWWVATSSPSIALSTLIAGVIAPSPKRSAAPNMAISAVAPMARPRAAREYSARIPPLPSLSARSTNMRYLTVTTRTNAQNISDSTPSTLSAVTGTWCGLSGLKHSLSAYSGLVPMSP